MSSSILYIMTKIINETHFLFPSQIGFSGRLQVVGEKIFPAFFFARIFKWSPCKKEDIVRSKPESI